MNIICENCDTKCRLGMCEGRDGEFKYCFRRVGSIGGLEKTITPFITLHELYDKQSWLDWVFPDSLVLDYKPYGNDNHMVLLWGISKIDGEPLPIGYVTVENTDLRDYPIEYKLEKNER